MTWFWVLAAVLLLAGYSFFLPVLLGRKSAEGMDRAQLNWLLNRQKREELAAEVDDTATARVLDEDLDRDLLGDLAQDEAALRRHPPDAGKSILALTLALIPLVVMALYGGLGRMDLIADTATPGETVAMNAGDIKASIQRLAERLKQQPNDLEGWLLLGRSLQATQQAEKAVTAYEFARKLAPDDPTVQAYYAEALAEANHGSLEGKPTEIITDILQRHPNHKHGLWLAGLAAVERKDFARAKDYWYKLRSLLPADSEDAHQIDNYLAELEGRLATETQTAVEPRSAGKTIHVRVSVTEELRNRAAANDTVFIFARAAEGPPMPLAVSRKRAADLPVEVTLSDGMAMAPGLNLSSFDRIVIGARISKTGNAMPSPGDLQGLTDPVQAQNGGSYSVEIREIVN
jgi:cytochrome c-type biogenesis protein CcmH